MHIKELMEIDVDNVIKKQHETLKNHVIGVLEDIIKLVKEEEYDKIINKIVYSPAGDGYGTNNFYINFSYYEDGEEDIDEIIDRLKKLKLQSEAEVF